MVDLNKSASETSIRDLLQMLWRGKFIILAVVLVATVIALAHYSLAIPVYKADALIMVKSPDKAHLIGDEGTGGEAALPTDVELLKSYPLANEVIHKLLISKKSYNLALFGNRESRTKGIMSGAASAQRPDISNTRPYAEALQSQIEAENIRGTSLIQLSVSSPFPDEAALLANTLCEAYRDKNTEWSAAQDISVSRIIEQQIDQQEQKLRETESALADFMKNNEVYEASGNVADLQRGYSAAETEYNSNRVQYDILRKQLAFVEQKLSAEERAFSNSLFQNISNELRSMRENIRSKENAYIELALQKGGKDPEVEAARYQLVNLKTQYDQINRKKIAGEIANSGNAQKYRFDLVASKMLANVRLAELDNSAREYERLKNYYQSRLKQLPAKQITYAKLQLDHEVANKTYAFLKEKLDEVRIKVASNAGGVVVLKSALPPEAPESPKLMQNLLIGLLGGLLLGVLVVVGKEKMA